ncbi:MAG: hypothetical protein HYY04_01705 [Chloroflexi bacterium]|nr:hypothetical protein [Chloroflexota bacterium]
MNGQTARFLFALRRNITLEGDLLLAEAELDAFLHDGVHGVTGVEEAVDSLPQLAALDGFGRLGSHARQSGTRAYLASGPLALLSDLIRRVSFVQRIYAITPDTVEARSLLTAAESALGPVIAYHVDEGHLVVQAIPHYALFELSDVVARRSASPAETKRNLTAVLDALLGRMADRRAVQLADEALSAYATTSHLSHDIHYYKAKFFPRMVRSLLNVCERRLGRGPHRVFDNFVGSGTTLLEAATLGIPSVGLDVDPLAVLIARAKLAAVETDSAILAAAAERATRALTARLRGQLELFDDVPAVTTDGVIPPPPGASPSPPAAVPEPAPPGGEECGLTLPAWLMKHRRMSPTIAAALSREIRVVQAVVTETDPAVRDLFRVHLSDAIARHVRMRLLGTGVGRFSLTFARTPLSQIFAGSIRDYVKVAAVAEWLRETLHLRLADAQAVVADARRIPDDLGRFDILVTSPPYLPASSGRESYAKARALSLIALGMRNHGGVDDLVDHSVGSMSGLADSDMEEANTRFAPTSFRRPGDENRLSLSALTEAERRAVEWLRGDELRAIKAGPTARYFLDMRQAFAEMGRVLLPGALAVVVSGKQSTFYRFSTRDALYTVPSAELLAEEARGMGFEVEALREVQLRKSNANARPRSLDDYYETLIFLRKP